MRSLRVASIALAASLCMFVQGGKVSPMWQTQFGPSTSTGEGRVSGPNPTSTIPLQAQWVLAPPNISVAIGPLIDADANMIAVAYYNNITNNNQFLAVSANASSSVQWLTPLTNQDQSACGPLAAVLDTCGFAYFTIACGPEPLSLENYLYKLNVSTGEIVLSSTVFGTGALTTLIPSSDESCSVLYATESQRDAPGALIVINATDGTYTNSFFGSTMMLATALASLSLSEDGSFLAVSNNAEAPYLAGFDTGASAAARMPSNAYDTKFRPEALPSLTIPTGLFNSTGPYGQHGSGQSYQYNIQWVPPVIMGSASDGSLSVVSVTDPQNGVNGSVNAVWKTYANGTVAWTTNLTSVSNTGLITAMAASTDADVIFVAMEVPGSQVGQLFFIDAASGTVAGSCPQTALCCNPAAIRGMAVDNRGGGSAVVYLSVINYYSNEGRPYESNGTLAFTYIAGYQYTKGAPFKCAASSAMLTTSSSPMQGDGPWYTPTAAPWHSPSAGGSGFFPPRWPTIAIGPANGMVTVLAPGAGIIQVCSAYGCGFPGED